MHRIGIDMGGTKIEGIVLSGALNEVHRKRVSTDQTRGYEAILGSIASLYANLVKAAGGPHTLGIGTPGALSPKTGLLKNSNTVCFNGRPVKKDLENLLGRSFAMQNDANCFALAETRFGAGRGLPVVFGVIIGTGCGGGIVVDGKVRGGLQSIAGEWGHSVLDPAGPTCYCGAKGCVETFISGGGLQKRWEAAAGKKAEIPEILRRFRAGEPAAAAFMNDFFAHFGRALANLINTLDPDAVVLGGGVSNIDELYTRGVSEVRRRVFSDSLETPILRHTLGDSAGVIGAALIGT